MRSCVPCLKDDPGIGLLDREAKGLAFHSHKHAFASELNFCAALRELSNTEKMPFDVALHDMSVSMQHYRVPPGPKTSYDTIIFLPEGIETPFAFLKCTFEEPKSRPP